MASNYNIMANYIVSKYIERVSGKDAYLSENYQKGAIEVGPLFY